MTITIFKKSLIYVYVNLLYGASDEKEHVALSVCLMDMR